MLLRIDERNRYLIQAAQQFYPGLSHREVARQLFVRLSRFREGSWRRYRTDALCPVRLVGRLDGALWCVLRCHDAIPAERTIRRALAAPSRGPTFGM